MISANGKPKVVARDCSNEDIRAGKVSYEPTNQELHGEGNKGMASHKLCIYVSVSMYYFNI